MVLPTKMALIRSILSAKNEYTERRRTRDAGRPCNSNTSADRAKQS